MLSNKPITDVLFLSVKTSSQSPTFNDIPSPILKGLFYDRYRNTLDDKIEDPWWNEATQKTERKGMERAYEEVYKDRAPLMAEFGKIICIAMGKIKDGKLSVMTFAGDNDKEILEKFFKIAVKSFGAPSLKELKDDICGHGLKRFQVPFIAKRTLINGIKLPAILDIADMKPWDLTYLIDTHEQWQMNQFEAYCGLNLLGASFGIPRTSEAIAGQEIDDIYWKQKDLKRIEQYAAEDIWTLANVYIKMKGLDMTITK